MKKILYIIGVTIALSSCYKSEIYNTPTPDKGTLELSTEWTNLHDGDVAPSSYCVLYNGEEYNVTEFTNTLTELEPKDDYEFLAYNRPSGISVVDGVAILGKATRAVKDLNPQPKHIYYGMGKVNLIKDFVAKLTITTKRGTAPMTLKLSYKKGELANIKSVKAELSGIATKKDLRTDAVTDKGTLTQYPSLDPKASELVLNYNILGTVGDEQKFTLTFTTMDDQTKVVTADLTAELAGFNSAMNALTLTGDMNLPTDLEAEGNITDWTEANNGDVDVN